MNLDTLDALGPLDGRYRSKVKELASKFSERGLITRRMKAEVEYFIALYTHHDVHFLPDRSLTVSDEATLRTWARNLTLEEAQEIKEIEKKTNHDVQAVIEHLRNRFHSARIKPWIHLPLTSEDINNIAYALQLRDALEEDIIPMLKTVYDGLRERALKWADHPMLARTHGQPASPTTLGKEINVFAQRLKGQLDKLLVFEILVKFNGASGNYNAHEVTFPEIDWVEFSKEFIESFNETATLKFRPNLVTTQIEPHDTYAELFDLLKRISTILIAFCQDTWRYISDDWIMQKPVEGETGSSAMPHKVNPIDFENAEGNLQMATALFEGFSRELPKSRLQRHLSDSTIIRNFGVGFGHFFLALKSLMKGLGKIEANQSKMLEALRDHPEVISEAIQTVLRRDGLESAYEDIKRETRGKKVTLKDLQELIQKMNVHPETREQLLAIIPENYIGRAPELARLEQ